MDDLLNIGLSNAVAAALLSLVAVAAGLVCRRPALVHGLWLIVLLKLVTPPLVLIPVAWPTETESAQLDADTIGDRLSLKTIQIVDDKLASLQPEEPATVLFLPASETEESPPVPSAAPVDSPQWSRILPVVWLAGSLGWFALALGRLVRFGRLLRHAQPGPNALQERARRLAERLGLTRCPQVCLLPGRLAPMLWAVAGSPRLLLPANLLDRLGDEQLDTILVHELAHLRRRDHWVRALEFLVMGLYWWHPVVWYARRELREAEEQCCDAWVVFTLPGAGRTYASALMDTLDFLSSAPPAVPLLASGLGQVSDLKRRLTMIMRGTTPRALSWPGCLTVLAVGAFFLPMLPALHAQAPRKETPKAETVNVRFKTFLIEEGNPKADLENARAELAAAKAQLQLNMAKVERAEAALQAAAAKGREGSVRLDDRQRLSVARATRFFDVQDARGGKPKSLPSVRIEIIAGPGVNYDDLKELLKKLEEAVPDKNRRTIILRAESRAPDQSMRKIEVSRPIKITGTVAESRPMPSPEKPHIILRTPLTVGQPDKRINDLEGKLEKVLQEMQELRKELKTRPGAKPESGGRRGERYDKNDTRR